MSRRPSRSRFRSRSFRARERHSGRESPQGEGSHHPGAYGGVGGVDSLKLTTRRAGRHRRWRPRGVSGVFRYEVGGRGLTGWGPRPRRSAAVAEAAARAREARGDKGLPGVSPLRSDARRPWTDGRSVWDPRPEHGRARARARSARTAAGTPALARRRSPAPRAPRARGVGSRRLSIKPTVLRGAVKAARRSARAPK